MARQADHFSQLPKYDWAFDANGEPVHISQAVRGGAYQCPITGQRMVARLGSIKQHHFAYDARMPDSGSGMICDPGMVARAVASRWVAKELRTCLEKRRAIRMTWTCALCNQTHNADLLAGVTRIEQQIVTGGDQPDVVLLDSHGSTPALIAFQPLQLEQRQALARQQVMGIVIDVAERRHHMVDLARLLAGASITGGVCATERRAAQREIVTDPDDLRRALSEAVSLPPYHLSGSLESLPEEDLTHLLTVNERLLWLPPMLWDRVVGGMRHAVSPTLHIITQEWPQDDGATIALYYVTVNDSSAVAVRRFPPGEGVYARLPNALFRTPRVTADHIARCFAEG